MIVSEFNRLNSPGIVQFLCDRTGLDLSEFNARLRDDSWTDNERIVMEKALQDWEKRVNNS